MSRYYKRSLLQSTCLAGHLSKNNAGKNSKYVNVQVCGLHPLTGNILVIFQSSISKVVVTYNVSHETTAKFKYDVNRLIF